MSDRPRSTVLHHLPVWCGCLDLSVSVEVANSGGAAPPAFYSNTSARGRVPRSSRRRTGARRLLAMACPPLVGALAGCGSCPVSVHGAKFAGWPADARRALSRQALAGLVQRPGLFRPGRICMGAA
jgi:hypothetical protein